MIYVKAKTVTFSITRGNSLHIMFSRWPQIPLEKIKFRKNTRICLLLFTSNRTIEKRKTAVGLSWEYCKTVQINYIVKECISKKQISKKKHISKKLHISRRLHYERVHFERSVIWEPHRPLNCARNSDTQASIANSLYFGFGFDFVSFFMKI